MATVKNRKTRPIAPSELLRTCPDGARTIRWEGALRLVRCNQKPDEQWWVDYWLSPGEALSLQDEERRTLRSF